ncbi:hypothetical protein E4U12_003228 [Claviceps purpurea]|nr:hypothetical protein E4U12_003228 [Claviceps purpurea]KAG6179419.1 hypothetical protein E4U36_005652 [Claviceps purpurea]
MTSLPTLFSEPTDWLAPDARNIPIQASTGLLPGASRDYALLLILFIVYYTALALDYLISWYLQTVRSSAQYYLSPPEPKEMNPAMAHKSPQPARQGFAIFDDGSPVSKDKHATWTAAADSAVLRELSKGKIQSRAVPVLDAAESPLTKSPRRESPCLEVKPTKAESVRFTACDQQSQAHSESFEPLVAVPEESSLVDMETGDAMAVQSPAKSGENQVTSSQLDEARQMLLVTEPNLSLEEQVDKHLAGQFEWIMEYPAGVASRSMAEDGVVQPGQGPSSINTVYGCNVLPVRRQQGASQTAELSTDMFTILATELTKHSCHYPLKAEHKDLANPSPDHLRHLPLPPYPETPLKVDEGAAEVKQVVSPALSMERERIEGVAGGSLISASRIEDSFEELDRLEDELEAVREVTHTHHHATGREKVLVQASPGNAKMKTPTAKVNKRVSIAGYSATVRVKPSQEKPPSSRRSASLTLRDARALQQKLSSEGSRVEAISCQGQRVTNCLSTPKAPAKSSKPRTVPNFELPGEAVARRLKEQREARLAQQAEAQKALASPAPKPRCHKSLALPTFELPGEAISRRKREGLEAKLRAQEEETKKRREFKARPLRQSMGPAVAPRETLTSRVRQSKPRSGATGEEGNSQKRMSLGCVGDHARASLTAKNKSSQPRIRTAHSGATSASTGSGSGKRNSVSLEELTVQRQQGRVILRKDKSIAQDKNQEKQERELTAKTAREQAADRSRMASREWAEKVRRKGLAGKQAKENRDDQKGTQA